ncbi:hypothetical protein BpHYR1_036904 [Brachionus plicatilis]|uniref:Uncharacterized protein n=1 Tax=Brachionus plicatilis TaxID=10195 RepID=A0A3M7PSL5_BRAPC|nr:hypothetical protein BpHYR1_036904 [Brachionus plicatilis]
MQFENQDTIYYFKILYAFKQQPLIKHWEVVLLEFGAVLAAMNLRNSDLLAQNVLTSLENRYGQ